MSELNRAVVSAVMQPETGARVLRAVASSVLQPDRGVRIFRATVSVVLSPVPPTPITEPVNAFILSA